MLCKCGKPMIKRSGRYGQFWGCTGYPKCRQTVKIRYVKKPIVKIKRDWAGWRPSAYQLTIKNAFVNSQDNLIIAAIAGSGKTTLLEWLATFTDSGIFLAFSKDVVNELKTKLPDNMQAKTLHSLGFEIIRQNIRARFDKNKEYTWLKKSVDDSKLITPIKMLAEKWRLTIADTQATDDQLDELCLKFNINTNQNAAAIYFYTRALIQYCYDTPELVSFSDMVWLPVVKGWSMVTGLVMVDEAQDLDAMQMALIRLLQPARLIFVGDINQAIYGFRGADYQAMARLKNTFDCRELPLSLSYRSSQAVTQAIKYAMPDIQHDCLPGADIGVFRHGQLMPKVGDMVICRTNAPMIAPVFELIKNGQRAYIEGRDIGTELTELIATAINETPTNTSHEQAISAHINKKIDNARSKAIRAVWQDKLNLLTTLINATGDLPELLIKIDQIFQDNGKGIKFSTVHKAKGLEAHTVYIIRPDLMPHPRAVTDEELQAEAAIKYVAWSRAINTLVIVD